MKTLGQLIVGLLASLAIANPSAAQFIALGAGGYHATPQGSDGAAPVAPYRETSILDKAAPTNQWYSGLIFNPKPEIIYAQPLTVLAKTSGFEMAYASKLVVPTERQDVEIHYPHTDPLVFSPTDFKTSTIKLAKYSDWAIDISLSNGADQLLATVAHGSPYSYFQLNRGNVQLSLPSGSQANLVNGQPTVLQINIMGKHYAAFAPTGGRWEQSSATQWLGVLPAGKGYFSAAALPDASAESLALLTKHAYSFLKDTRVDWRFDEAASVSEVKFKATTQAMEGINHGPLLGLYPHQWHKNALVEPILGAHYETIRGKIRLLAASQFTVNTTYRGFVPFWPAVEESKRKSEIADLTKTDVRNARRMMLEIGNGSYWQGKGLQRISKLADVVEQQGDLDARDQLHKLMKNRIETWFSGKDRKTYFHYDKTLGTVAAYPEEYFSVEQMNDHHFHYGYWIRTMADIALRDPDWASKKQWGAMVDLLIADIATAERSRTDFPFLRNFDMYEGHSWASGIGLGEFGNNQESSSEAINAWAGLILWADITGNTALRDLGVYLYTSEIEAINHYWFDIHGLVFASEYKSVEVSMLFGGKYAHNTWWIDDPRQIKGINLLPITTSSTYLGRDPAFTKKSLATLKPETAIFQSRGKRADPPDIWQDIFAKYLALSDPEEALNDWNRWGSFELGDTRSHALHWMASLEKMGVPDFETTANTTLYAVFHNKQGKKTYLAYNTSATPITVRFSDGQTLPVPPRSLAQR